MHADFALSRMSAIENRPDEIFGRRRLVCQPNLAAQPRQVLQPGTPHQHLRRHPHRGAGQRGDIQLSIHPRHGAWQRDIFGGGR